MNILFDGRVFQFQKAGGINRYFAEIISSLPPEWIPMVTGVRDFGQNAPRHANLRRYNPLPIRPQRFMRRFQRAWCRLRLGHRINLMHPTYYDLTCGLKLTDFKCPLVTTVHDMIYARFPQETEGAAEVIRAQRESVLRADRIVCISQHTEKDLLEFVPEAAGKTSVIYHGSSFPLRDVKECAEVFEKPTFLFVGGRGGYKNFLFLLRAFAKAASVVPEIRLIVAGPPLTSEERWQLSFLKISSKINSIVFPEEPVLEEIYRNSVALLYPSRYEGFGIPPLEAMACETVAVTANTTSLPEVVGDGGIMLDPTDENAWTECIIKLSRPFSGREQLLARGRNRVQQFTWAECARKHLEIYRKLS